MTFTLLISVVCLGLLSGCLPTPSKRISSTVYGIITKSGSPVENAKIAIGYQRNDHCIKLPPPTNVTGTPTRLTLGLTKDGRPLPKSTQPYKLTSDAVPELPITATSAQDGSFHTEGESSWGVIRFSREPFKSVKFCIYLDDVTLYTGSISYFGNQPPSEIHVICELDREKICQLGKY